MNISRIFPYEKLNRVTDELGSRYYVSPTGARLFSVTTILGATAYMPELIAWRERVGVVEANRIRDEATGLGSLMHEHLENYVLGLERPKGNNMVRILAKNMADQVINRGLSNISEVHGIEESLYFPDLFAGTADLVCMHKGTLSIADYKTSKVMKKPEMIKDYFLQLSAYALAHDEIYNTKITKGVIFMVDRNLQFKEFIVEGLEFEKCKQEWIKRVEQFLALPL